MAASRSHLYWEAPAARRSTPSSSPWVERYPTARTWRRSPGAHGPPGVFVVQCAGARVARLAPPHPPLEPDADPFARGKGILLTSAYPSRHARRRPRSGICCISRRASPIPRRRRTRRRCTHPGLAPPQFWAVADSLRIAARAADGLRSAGRPGDAPRGRRRDVRLRRAAAAGVSQRRGRLEVCQKLCALALDGPVSTFRESRGPLDDATPPPRTGERTTPRCWTRCAAPTPGDARPASARVAHRYSTASGAGALWNPRLEKLRAKIAAAVVDRMPGTSRI